MNQTSKHADRAFNVAVIDVDSSDTEVYGCVHVLVMVQMRFEGK